MCRFLGLVSLFMVIAVGGCISENRSRAGSINVAVAHIYSGSFWSSQVWEPETVWIETLESLQAAWQSMHSHILGGSVRPVPDIDFGDYGILIISLGKKSTGGYSLELADSMAQVVDCQAIVNVNRIEPHEEVFVTQVITNPYLMLKIERAEYETVKVQDQNNKIIGSVDIPS